MVLISATAFGTNAILGKLAYRAGLGTSQTLMFRFVLAAIGMWGLALILHQNPLRFRRSELGILLALGGIVYTGQSLAYFTALRTLPASLVVLIAYIYPSLVVFAGWLFLRRSVSMRHGWWPASSGWCCWSVERSCRSRGRSSSRSRRRRYTRVTSCWAKG